jgi:uncharacterized protein with GYD domain
MDTTSRTETSGGAHALLDRSRVGNHLTPRKETLVPQYLIVGQHPPNLCPAANETIRKLSQEGGAQIPELAEKLGVKVTATYVPMNNHMVFAAVQGDDMATVREFAFQSRLGQWNTIDIYQVATLEEALTKVNELPTIYA